jgi:hypothetical protein
MAHFAKMNGDSVVDVVVVNNSSIDNLPFPESEPVGISFLHELYQNNDVWLQTSYNNNFRGNYAGIGYQYWADIDQFVPPQPYPSWIYNPITAQWEAPIPKPYPAPTGYVYVWDEETQSWVLVPRNQSAQ